MNFIILSFAVFGLTLLVTKSQIFACKRKYVESRYESSKINGQPGFIHTWFYKMWTCPMCFGVWVAAAVCCWCIVSPYGWFINTMAVAGSNWLIHCLESYLFNLSELLDEEEKNDKKP